VSRLTEQEGGLATAVWGLGVLFLLYPIRLAGRLWGCQEKHRMWPEKRQLKHEACLGNFVATLMFFIMMLSYWWNYCKKNRVIIHTTYISAGSMGW